MKRKINRFQGLYTDVNELLLTGSDQGYSEYITGKVRNGYIENKDYKIVNTKEDDNYLYFDYIILDADKHSYVKKEDGTFENVYLYDPQRYYLTIRELSNTKFKLELYSNGTSNEPDYAFIIENERFVKILANSGKVYLFTDKSYYELKRVNRENLYGKLEEIVLFNLDFEIAKSGKNEFNISTVDKYKANKTIRIVLTNEEFEEEIEHTISIYNVMDFYSGENYGSIYYWVNNTEEPCLEIDVTARRDIQVNDEDVKDYIENNTSNKITVDINQEGDIDNCIGYINAIGELKNLINEEIKAIDYDKLESIKEHDVDSNLGFSSMENGFYFVLNTLLLEDGSEVIMNEEKRFIDVIASEDNYYMLYSTLKVDEVTDKNVFGLRTYIKFTENSPYEKISEFNFYDKNLEWIEEEYDEVNRIRTYHSYLGKINLSGIYLSQTFGYNDFKDAGNRLLGFQDAEFIGNMLIVSYSNKVYYPTIGNGKVTFSIYDTQVIPNVEGKGIIPIQSSAIGIIDYNSLKIVHIDASNGIPIFTLSETIGFVLNSPEQALSTPDGIILNTNDGIYITNASGIKNISQQINNVVKDNYANSSIEYDYLDNVLFYFIDSGDCYIYQFDENVWRNNKELTGIKLSDRNNLVRDIYNNLFLFAGNKIYTLQLMNVNESIIIPLFINANDLSYLYKITHIEFDFEGVIIVKFNNVDEILLDSNKVRDTKIAYVPIERRIPEEYSKFEIKLIGDTKLYGYEINYLPEKKLNENIV